MPRKTKPATTIDHDAKPQSSNTKPGRVSALDAAAKVLAGVPSTDGLTSKQLIVQMADRGLWTSPAGKTPNATLYAAMLREIANKGESSRFRRVGPGRFALATAEPRTKRPVRRTKTQAEAKSVSKGDEVIAGANKPAPRKRRRARAAS